jgi:hypothetical protein
MHMGMRTVRMNEIGIEEPLIYTSLVFLERINVNNAGDCFYSSIG